MSLSDFDVTSRTMFLGTVADAIVKETRMQIKKCPADANDVPIARKMRLGRTYRWEGLSQLRLITKVHSLVFSTSMFMEITGLLGGADKFKVKSDGAEIKIIADTGEGVKGSAHMESTLDDPYIQAVGWTIGHSIFCLAKYYVWVSTASQPILVNKQALKNLEIL